MGSKSTAGSGNLAGPRASSRLDSCEDDEEGKGMSLYARAKRALGEWPFITVS